MNIKPDPGTRSPYLLFTVCDSLLEPSGLFSLLFPLNILSFVPPPSHSFLPICPLPMPAGHECLYGRVGEYKTDRERNSQSALLNNLRVLLVSLLNLKNPLQVWERSGYWGEGGFLITHLFKLAI